MTWKYCRARCAVWLGPKAPRIGSALVILRNKMNEEPASTSRQHGADRLLISTFPEVS